MNLLLEDSRSSLVAQSRTGKKEKDGLSRFEKRKNCKIAPSVSNYNKIDMNLLFKEDILNVTIDVNGETDKYQVKIVFSGFLEKLRNRLKDKPVSFRYIVQALVDSYNSEDVFVHCSCEDWKYRMDYWATRNNITSDLAQNIPSKETNPNNDLGPVCKHVALILSNRSFLLKIASVINNYIKYAERNMKKAYADIIYPAIYGREYQDDVQLSIFDDKGLESDEETIDVSNKQGAVSGRFSTTNQPRR